MSDTPINLYNAPLFSALAYAPNGFGYADSEAWALLQPGTQVYSDAQTLQSQGWYDITGELATKYGLNKDYFWNRATNTAFHVFENSNTKQIVFSFRGSTSPVTSLKNWAADLTLADEGYT